MFQGSITALITPFTEDGSVDAKRYQKFVDWQIKEGTHGLVPVGTTGESPTLTHEEHHHVVELCIEAAGGRVPVMAGTGSNSTREAISLTQAAQKMGADAALIVTPYYNKPNQAGLYAHFKAIHDATDLPIYIYNIPGRSVIDMGVETMAALAELPRIAGVKDATGDLERAAQQYRAMGPDFIMLSGDDPTSLAFYATGGRGTISVTSNIAPKLCSDFHKACLAGDYKTALALQNRLLPLHRAMFIEPSPAPAKFVGSLLGICTDRVRLPLLPLTDVGRATLASLVSEVGLGPVNFD
ncbi:4-hydroxy-tetrahydrodipicolinate synthase [Gimibacter soli]|uniref:4-hydroxy-tetrahydrodipicolinate synthase n=1 Tax=Gimibacter soli TaxID=3024400 RepID=A0AAF0BMM4_9PROT|nr:4-hydroxy-tetrahydrodipicolinate synthase [Gimibacter soli]WCL55727.1 4-hydroxy-tetrahydrodipicolinate synthase [Gimibacter soli]